jgi:hypothetical protein
VSNKFSSIRPNCRTNFRAFNQTVEQNYEQNLKHFYILIDFFSVRRLFIFFYNGVLYWFNAQMQHWKKCQSIRFVSINWIAVDIFFHCFDAFVDNFENLITLQNLNKIDKKISTGAGRGQTHAYRSNHDNCSAPIIFILRSMQSLYLMITRACPRTVLKYKQGIKYILRTSLNSLPTMNLIKPQQ